MSFFITGDTHGKFSFVHSFVLYRALNENDCIIILGDTGLNYYLDDRDKELKDYVNSFGCKIFSIRGNHDANPETISTYRLVKFHGADALQEKGYPNLYFGILGEVYNFNGLKTLVLDGSYSIDKYIRLERGWNWFADEQPNAFRRKCVEQQINQLNWKVDCVLSHTCPLKFEPVELFLPFIDQSIVDKTMEKWLDKIENKLTYDKWYFGHFHGDKVINDKVKMLYHSIEEYGKDFK